MYSHFIINLVGSFIIIYQAKSLLKNKKDFCCQVEKVMSVLRFIIFFSFVSCIFLGCANLLCDNGVASACSLEAITITPSTASISKGLVQPFIATGTYKDGSTKSINDEVEWSSSNTEIAAVNESGLVSKKDFGTSIIIFCWF